MQSRMILDIAKKIIKQGAICDHCLGRQFAKLLHGFSNEERGRALKIVLSIEAEAQQDNELKNKLKEEGKCWVCNGLFKNIDSWVEKAIKALSDYEYDNFLVGTRITGLLAENEEILWAENEIKFAEPLKAELNREVGKRIEKITGKKANFKKPQIVVLLDLENNDVKLEVNSLYIYGRYRKLIRGIPQTRWPCRDCKGKGCEKCGYTGKRYKESVDELIRPHVINATQCKDTVFHGAGREDIDALMLGNGRPFVVEAKKPHKRHIDLHALEAQINNANAGKIQVMQLRFADKSMAKKLKSMKATKVYRVKIMHNTTEEKLKSGIEQINGVLIKQKTPRRVLHRRADIVRERRVHEAKLEYFDEDIAILKIHCDGGLYVKELITGDEGRTRPSIAELTGSEAKVIELEVIKICDTEEYEWQKPMEQEENHDINLKKQ